MRKQSFSATISKAQRTCFITLLLSLLVMAGSAQAQNKKKATQKSPATSSEQKEVNIEEAFIEEPGVKRNVVGTVIYNAKELSNEDMAAAEESRIYSDDYNKNNTLPALKGEELTTAYGADFGYFEFRNLRVYYNVRENNIIVAYRPDANTSYFSRLRAEELFGPDNMMFRDLLVMRWDMPNDEADNIRGEYYTNSMQEAKICGATANRFTYSMPAMSGVLWAFPKLRVDTWCLPFLGMDYIVADGITTMPFCPKGLRYHMQVSKISTEEKHELWIDITNGKETEWEQLRPMIEKGFAKK